VHNVFKFGRTTYILLFFVPVSIFLGFFTQEKTLTLITTVLAIVPLARIIGYATSELANQTSPSFGGLLNATFGNAVELIIAIFALSNGLLGIVQASIIGSILSNLLLLIGLSIFFGGLKYKEQRFYKDSVGVSSTMLIIAIVGLAIPTAYSLGEKMVPATGRIISDAVAVVLALAYLAGLIFAFVTHKHLYTPEEDNLPKSGKRRLTPQNASLLLFLATVMVIFESELLIDGFKYATTDLGLSQTFLGVVVVAIITNIAEKASAIRFALGDKLDIALEIGLSSAIQIALFVVPILVLFSHVYDYGFSLFFSPFEIVSVFFAVMIVNHLASDGKCNWLEGVQLISVYLIIAVAFYFI
jgi:Ca2+:H+ antiporter